MCFCNLELREAMEERESLAKMASKKSERLRHPSIRAHKRGQKSFSSVADLTTLYYSRRRSSSRGTTTFIIITAASSASASQRNKVEDLTLWLRGHQFLFDSICLAEQPWRQLSMVAEWR